MESDHSTNTDSPSSDEEIVLQGKKLDSPEKEKTAVEESMAADKKEEKQEVKKRQTSAKLPSRVTKPSSSLVLQMFSHMKTQKRIQEEKTAKLARAERQFQKVKGGSVNRNVFADRSINTFGGYWTQQRLTRLPLDGRPQSHGTNVGISHTDTAPGSANTSPVESQHNISKTETHIIRVPSGSEGSPRHIGRQTVHSAVPSSFKFSTNPRLPSSEPGAPSASPRFLKHNVSHTQNRVDRERTQTDGSIRNNSASTRGGSASIRNRATHILKGPGRLQIHFSPSPVSPSHRAHAQYSQRKQSYEWDNMPAGSIRAGPPKLVTIDGGLL